VLTFKSRAAAGERVSEFYRALRIKVKGFFQKARRRNDLKLVNGYEELDLRTLSIFSRARAAIPFPPSPPSAHKTSANFCLFPAMYLRRGISVIDTERASRQRSDYFIFNVVEL